MVRAEMRRLAREAGGITAGQSINKQIEAEKERDTLLENFAQRAARMCANGQTPDFARMRDRLRSVVEDILKQQFEREGKQGPAAADILKEIDGAMERLDRTVSHKVDQSSLDSATSKATRLISLLDIIHGKAGGLPTSAANATSYIDT